MMATSGGSPPFPRFDFSAGGSLMSASNSDHWRPRRVAIVGPGLLGGSFALALKRWHPAVQILGYARRGETVSAALDAGVLDAGGDSLVDACRDCDLICVATPVDVLPAQVIEAAQVCAPEALVTDVGSTKASIVAAIERDPAAGRVFVGSHPIAGGEKSGPEHARADLFDGRTVVVTPGERSDPERLVQTCALWRHLGAGAVLTTTPTEHDHLLAATSHLPHLVAAALAALLPEAAEPFVGPGWRSTTRVAGGSAEMWSAICRDNGPAIVAQLDQMSAQLDLLRAAIASGEAGPLVAMLERARANRLRAGGA
jgi:prephenate dehydrogenase